MKKSVRKSKCAQRPKRKTKAASTASKRKPKAVRTASTRKKASACNPAKVNVASPTVIKFPRNYLNNYLNQTNCKGLLKVLKRLTVRREALKRQISVRLPVRSKTVIHGLQRIAQSFATKSTITDNYIRHATYEDLNTAHSLLCLAGLNVGFEEWLQSINL